MNPADQPQGIQPTPNPEPQPQIAAVPVAEPSLDSIQQQYPANHFFSSQEPVQEPALQPKQPVESYVATETPAAIPAAEPSFAPEPIASQSNSGETLIHPNQPAAEPSFAVTGEFTQPVAPVDTITTEPLPYTPPIEPVMQVDPFTAAQPQQPYAFTPYDDMTSQAITGSQQPSGGGKRTAVVAGAVVLLLGFGFFGFSQFTGKGGSDQQAKTESQTYSSDTNSTALGYADDAVVAEPEISTDTAAPTVDETAKPPLSASNGTPGAVNASGGGEQALPPATTPLLVPDVPAAPLLASVEGPQIQVATGEVANAGQYITEYSESPSFTIANTVVSGTADAVIVDLKPQTKYYVRTKAINGAGSSNWSKFTNISTPIGRMPVSAETPTLKAMTVKSAYSVQASWSAVSSATHYQLEYALDPNFTTGTKQFSASPVKARVAQLAKSSTQSAQVLKAVDVPLTYAVNDLSPDTTYYFRLRAVNNGSASQWSGAEKAKTPELTTQQLNNSADDNQTRFNNIPQASPEIKNLLGLVIDLGDIGQREFTNLSSVDQERIQKENKLTADRLSSQSRALIDKAQATANDNELSQLLIAQQKQSLNRATAASIDKLTGYAKAYAAAQNSLQAAQDLQDLVDIQTIIDQRAQTKRTNVAATARAKAEAAARQLAADNADKAFASKEAEKKRSDAQEYARVQAAKLQAEADKADKNLQSDLQKKAAEAKVAADKLAASNKAATDRLNAEAKARADAAAASAAASKQAQKNAAAAQARLEAEAKARAAAAAKAKTVAKAKSTATVKAKTTTKKKAV